MSTIIDRTIELEDLTMHYREVGEAGAPPLILLHGLTSNAQDWDEITPMLAERYHVFALDQRGHGTSTRPEAYSFELMRDDVKEFADKLSLDHFTLIGHSMGGTIAFLFAEKYPERLERLVLEDTPPPFIGMMDPDSPEPPAEAPEAVPFDWPVLTSIIKQLRNPDPTWWNDQRKITAPTLIIAGGSTSHVPQEKLAEVAAMIPNCQLVTIEGAGHEVHKNRPEEYKEILQSFLFG